MTVIFYPTLLKLKQKHCLICYKIFFFLNESQWKHNTWKSINVNKVYQCEQQQNHFRQLVNFIAWLFVHDRTSNIQNKWRDWGEGIIYIFIFTMHGVQQSTMKQSNMHRDIWETCTSHSKVLICIIPRLAQNAWRKEDTASLPL